jgi:hypothetical protein
MELRDVLQDPESFDWSLMLYLEPSPWTLSSTAMALSTDDLAPDEKMSPEAAAAGLREVMTVATVQDMVEHLRGQGIEATIEQRFEAFLNYVDNDAFIDVKDLRS